MVILKCYKFFKFQLDRIYKISLLNCYKLTKLYNQFKNVIHMNVILRIFKLSLSLFFTFHIKKVKFYCYVLIYK